MVSLFTLRVPALAEEAPVEAAEEPVATEEPIVTGEPVVTEELEEPEDEPEPVSDFSGKFTDVKQINDYAHSVQLSSLTYKAKTGTTKIVSEGSARVRYVYEDAYGLTGGKTFYIYTPDAPVSKLPEGYLNWMLLFRPGRSKNKLGFYGLYNVSQKQGWHGTK